jgi:cytochrome P450
MNDVTDLSTETDALPSDPRIPVLDFDPFAVDVIDDPYAFDRELLDAGPIVWLRKYRMYAVGRFAEAQVAFSDDSRFLCTGGVGLTDIRKPESLRDKNPLMEVEPEVHRRVRASMMKILSPAAMRGHRPRFEAKANEYVDRVIRMGSFDGVHDLVEPFILDVFPETVGIKINPETVLLFGDLNFNANGPLNDLYREAYKRVEKHLPTFEESFRRENMTPGGVGAQLYEAEDAGIFDPGTAFGFVRVLFRGGFDTTIAGINGALYGLSQNPEAWNWLKQNPDKALNAFDEALRHVSPFRVSHRVTIPEGCEFAGVRLDGDRKVGIYMEAANRDPRKWPESDKYDIQRANITDHLAFGHGAHKCIGLLVARYEAEALIKAVVTRMGRLEFAAPEAVSYKRINTLRTLKALPLRATA